MRSVASSRSTASSCSVSGPLGAFTLATVGGDAQQLFDNLPAGSYAITESLPAGWGQVSATCDNGDAPGSLTIDPGERVICSFVNAQLPGVLVVRTTTVGGEGIFSFSSPQVGDFSLTTSGGAAAQSFPNLAPGVYNVTELAAAGWQPAGATCDNGDAPGNVTIDPGETVTCTFANAKLGSITIVKVAENGNGVFQFTSQALGNFSLTTLGSAFRGTAQRVFADLAPGSYDIQAPQPAGWVFVSASCSDSRDPANIVLGVAENVTCTYVSRPEPTALPEGEEPEMFNKMFLPLINR